MVGLWVLKAIRSPLRSTALTHISGDMEAALLGPCGSANVCEGKDAPWKALWGLAGTRPSFCTGVLL